MHVQDEMPQRFNDVLVPFVQRVLSEGVQG
jgi:hypothetical protein